MAPKEFGPTALKSGVAESGYSMFIVEVGRPKIQRGLVMRISGPAGMTMKPRYQRDLPVLPNTRCEWLAEG